MSSIYLPDYKPGDELTTITVGSMTIEAPKGVVCPPKFDPPLAKQERYIPPFLRDK